MSTILEDFEAFKKDLEDVLGTSVAVVTTNAQEARPSEGLAAVLIEPPELTSESYSEVDAITMRIDVIAGGKASQAESLPTLLNVCQILIDSDLAVTSMRPITMADTNTTRAAYQIEINY